MSWLSRFTSTLSHRRRDADRPDDFVAIGYPKTGNTWTRIMLGRYVELAYELPFMPLFDVGERQELTRIGYGGPFGSFTHSPLTPEAQTADDLAYENVVAPFEPFLVLLLVRHPLDTLISSYMQAVHRTAVPYDGTLPDFFDHPVHGLDKLLRFYQLWAEHLGRPRGLLIWRYEDLAAVPGENLGKLVRFLGAKCDRSIIEETVRYASFENMRQMERSDNVPVYRSSQLSIFATGDRDNPDAYHVRRGKSGAFREYLSKEICSRLESRIANEMPRCYGY